LSLPYRILVLSAVVFAAGCSPPEPPGSNGTNDGGPNPPRVNKDNNAPSQGPAPTSTAGLAPDFTVIMLDGRTVRLRDLAGKPVVVHFWGTWCYWCKKESPILDKIYQTYRSKGVEFVPISVGDTQQKVVDYLKDNRLHWTSALDPRGAIAAQYKIRGYPSTVLVDRSGRIYKTHVGMAKETAWVEMMDDLLATR
jgi:cytochrome c biogenesis protein CcmG/thiol:disulfide interchange protein DsbE